MKYNDEIFINMHLSIGDMNLSLILRHPETISILCKIYIRAYCAFDTMVLKGIHQQSLMDIFFIIVSQ